jgi:hypothetical protein
MRSLATLLPLDETGRCPVWRSDMRFRIQTIMMGVVIAGLVMALAVREWQAARREAVLRVLLNEAKARHNQDLRAYQSQMQVLQRVKALNDSLAGNGNDVSRNGSN